MRFLRQQRRVYTRDENASRYRYRQSRDKQRSLEQHRVLVCVCAEILHGFPFSLFIVPSVSMCACVYARAIEQSSAERTSRLTANIICIV